MWPTTVGIHVRLRAISPDLQYLPSFKQGWDAAGLLKCLFEVFRSAQLN